MHLCERTENSNFSIIMREITVQIQNNASTGLIPSLYTMVSPWKRVSEWVHGQVCGWVHWWVRVWVRGWMHGWVLEWVHGGGGSVCVSRWLGAWMNAWADARASGWVG